MKMTYDWIRSKPKQFQSLCGLGVSEFEYLHETFSEITERDLQQRTWEGLERKRRFTFKRDSVFGSSQDMLLFILVYLKQNPTQQAHAAMFGMTQPQANIRLHRLTDCLGKTLKRLGELPARDRHEFALRVCDAVELLLDGTERPIPRPSDEQTQKEHYSGKKKAIESSSF